MGFSEDMQRATNNIDSKLRKTVSRGFTDLCTRIIDDTPVGNKTEWYSANKAVEDGKVESVQDYKPNYVPGTLVNSWYAGIGNMIPQGLTPREPNTSGGTSLGSVQKVADEATGQVAWFANPAPHAMRAEYLGWPINGPGPYAMVRTNVNIFKDIFRIAFNESK
jgi:hypothetical protein